MSSKSLRFKTLSETGRSRNGVKRCIIGISVFHRTDVTMKRVGILMSSDGKIQTIILVEEIVLYLHGCCVADSIGS